MPLEFAASRIPKSDERDALDLNGTDQRRVLEYGASWPAAYPGAAVLQQMMN
jgi:hypothetical protein